MRHTLAVELCSSFHKCKLIGFTLGFHSSLDTLSYSSVSKKLKIFCF